MSAPTALAVDLGSSTGRVIAGTLRDGVIEQQEVHRFAHEASLVDGYLCWDLDGIWEQIQLGLQRGLAQFPDALSVSVDTWGVDWVPLDVDGDRLTPGRCYRDLRTERTRDAFRAALPDEQAWALTGIAPAAINSANQLFAYLREEPELAAQTSSVLFLPDYFGYLLSGVPAWSRSISSTSGLCEPGAQAWASEVFEGLGIPTQWVGELTAEFSVAGQCRVPGLEQLTVVRAGAHDSACAVTGLQQNPNGATYFLSCGSWSVLGALTSAPLLSAEAKTLGGTNEARADGGVRPLFNITGMWILQECQRQWRAAGKPHEIGRLVEAARLAPPIGLVIDPDDPRFAAKGNMVERVTGALAEQGWRDEVSPGQLVRCVLESFANRYAKGVGDLVGLTGEPASQLNLVGGGARNKLLCELTASALGMPVVAGPVEAATLGALLGQFEILGCTNKERRSQLIAATAATTRHLP